MNCILCEGPATLFFIEPRNQYQYLHCQTCDLRFLHPRFRLTSKEEHSRYLLHKNDINDLEYQKFVSPLYKVVLDRCSSDSIGLDYGCGAAPVVSHLLTQQGYSILHYDPFFKPDIGVLEKKYRFILAVEVVEHFYDPGRELLKLSHLLDPEGALGIMTLLYNPTDSFESWYYKNDPTHVCFYSELTFQWIVSKFGFSSCTFYAPRTLWLSR